MTSRSAVLSAVCALGLMCSALSFAQDVTVGDLMAKGATYLSAEELKACYPARYCATRTRNTSRR